VVGAAFAGLQDTAPRDALVALHARTEGCAPGAWEDPALAQVYGPRQAVYLVPRRDLGVFTLGRLPADPRARAAVDAAAERLSLALQGDEPMRAPADTRRACMSGRFLIRWTTSALVVREIQPPEMDVEAARIELARRHLRAFAPTTVRAFAWWAGIAAPDAVRAWQALGEELAAIRTEDGTDAAALAVDVPALLDPPRPEAVRLLPAPDLRLFGFDRSQWFVGPGLRKLSPVQDTHHPNGVLSAGRIVGAWGRRGGAVEVVLERHPGPVLRDAIEAEARSMPIPRHEMSVVIRAGT
jgi:hypothetical protein